MSDNRAQPVPSLGASYLANVPQSVRDDIDRALLDAPGAKPNIAEIHRCFSLKDKHAVSLTTFRRYTRRLLRNKQLRALANTTADADPGPPPEPVDIDRLQRHVQLLVLQNLARALDDTELTPAELFGLTRVFIAYRKVQLETQKLADGPLPDADALDRLEQRVQLLILEQLVRALEDSELTPAETCSITRVFVAYRKVQLDTQKLAATTATAPASSPGQRAVPTLSADGQAVAKSRRTSGYIGMRERTKGAGAPPLPGVGDGHLAPSPERKRGECPDYTAGVLRTATPVACQAVGILGTPNDGDIARGVTSRNLCDMAQEGRGREWISTARAAARADDFVVPASGRRGTRRPSGASLGVSAPQ